MTDLTLAAAHHGIDLDPAAPYAHRLLARGKHLPGQHSQATHGGGGGGMTVMTADEWAAKYESYDNTEFGGGPGGQGQVYSMTDGSMQIAFDQEDGSALIFSDISYDEADSIAENIDWARGMSPVNTDDIGDRGPDEDTGLFDWKASDTVLTGYTGSSYQSDDAIGLATDGGAKFTLSSKNAGDLQQALQLQSGSAQTAEQEFDPDE